VDHKALLADHPASTSYSIQSAIELDDSVNAYISFVPVPWLGPATVASRTNSTLQVETPLKTQVNSGGADVETDKDLWARLAVQAGPIVPDAFALQTDNTSRMRIS
jgi:hypothetical protein